MQALLPVMTVLERGGKFAQCVKYGCELQGLPGGAVRAPLRPMGKALKEQMRAALTTAQADVRRIQKNAGATRSRAGAKVTPIRRAAKG